MKEDSFVEQMVIVKKEGTERARMLVKLPHGLDYLPVEGDLVAYEVGIGKSITTEALGIIEFNTSCPNERAMIDFICEEVCGCKYEQLRDVITIYKKKALMY